jgi:hypothetical protein
MHEIQIKTDVGNQLNKGTAPKKQTLQFHYNNNQAP